MALHHNIDKKARNSFCVENHRCPNCYCPHNDKTIWCSKCLLRRRQKYAASSTWGHPTKAQSREYAKRRRENHPEEVKAAIDKWNKANPQKRALMVARRYNIQRQLPATLTESEWDDILLRHNYSCAYCGVPQDSLSHTLEKDHVIPVTQGGGLVASNIVPACKSCNVRKGGRTPEEAGMPLLSLPEEVPEPAR